MTGFCGVFGALDAEAGHAITRRMVEVFEHENNGTSEIYRNSTHGVFLGWTSAENSACRGSAIWNQSRDLLLIFSGEDFSDTSNVVCNRNGGAAPEDASHILRLYENAGEKFVESVNGWFSGVLVDLRKRTTILFNDRYGLGRVYICKRPDGFYFASEAKSLLSVLPDQRQIDNASLAEFFSMGCVLQNRTLFTGIELLPPASRWKVSPKGDVDQQSYFQPSQWTNLPTISDDEYYERLRDVISRIVPRYRSGSRQVAMSLTGGLDGRIIMAWADAEPGELPCYTFGGPYRDCIDLRIARRVAQLADQPHQTIHVGPEFLAQFPELARKSVYQSDGTMDVSGAVELYVNNIARKIAPVRLTGNYGSEVIRQNIAFRPWKFADHLLSSEFATLVEQASATYYQERVDSDISFVAFKQVPWHHYARFAVERSQLTPRSPYLDNELVKLMHQAPQEAATDEGLLFRLVADGNPKLAGPGTDVGLMHQPIPVVTRLNRLRRAFINKAEYAYDAGMPQWLAQVDRVLGVFKPERLFLGRNKFYHFRVWYRDDLSEYVKEILLDPRSRSRPYLDGHSLEQMVMAHTAGRANFTEEIHTFLTIELVHRTLIEKVGQ